MSPSRWSASKVASTPNSYAGLTNAACDAVDLTCASSTWRDFSGQQLLRGLAAHTPTTSGHLKQDVLDRELTRASRHEAELTGIQ